MRIRMSGSWVLFFGLIASSAQADETSFHDTLFNMNLNELMNVEVVTASATAEQLADAPATMIVLSRNDIERRGYTRLYEVLDDLPGFDQIRLYGDTFVKPYARGFRNAIGDAVLVMIDGQVFNHLFFNTADDILTTPSLEQIERIEVVYGPASSLYGPNAFMGVINLITRNSNADSDALRLSLRGGSLEQRGIDISYQQQLGEWRLSAAAHLFEGQMDYDAADRYPYTSRSLLYDPNGWGGIIFGQMLNYFPAEKPYQSRFFDLRLASNNLEFGAQHLSLRRSYGLMWVWDHYLQGATYWDKPEYAYFARASFDVHPDLHSSSLVRYRLSNVTSNSMEFDVSWLDDNASPDGSSGFYATPQHWSVITSSLSFRQDFTWRLSPRNTLQFGLTLSEETQQTGYVHSNPDWEPLYRTDIYDGRLPIEPEQDLGDLNHFRVQRYGGYLQGRFPLAEHQHLVLGGRYDHHSIFGGDSNLRGGYVGQFGSWTLKALYGQAYNEPNPRQLYGGWAGSGSNVALQPEQSETLEFSAGYTKTRWSLSANTYWVRNKSVILNTPEGARNLGTQDIIALELHPQWLLATPGATEIKLWAHLAHNFKQSNSPWVPVANVANSNDLPDIARTKIHFGQTLSLTEHRFITLKGRYIGKRFTPASNPVGQLGSYLLLDLYAQTGWQLANDSTLSLGLKINNLLDRHYALPGMRSGGAGLIPPAFNADGHYVGSQNYDPSLLPQAGRTLELMLSYRY